MTTRNTLNPVASSFLITSLRRRFCCSAVSWLTRKYATGIYSKYVDNPVKINSNILFASRYSSGCSTTPPISTCPQYFSRFWAYVSDGVIVISSMINDPFFSMLFRFSASDCSRFTTSDKTPVSSVHSPVYARRVSFQGR